MLTKIISGVLVAVILFMGVKQGLAMITGKPEMLEMFDKLFVRLDKLFDKFGSNAPLAVLLTIKLEESTWDRRVSILLFIIVSRYLR